MVSSDRKAIQSANIGVNPNSDGDSVKLFFPPMTMDREKRLQNRPKLWRKRPKIAIRNIRKEVRNRRYQKSL